MNFRKIILTIFLIFLFGNKADAIKIGLITGAKEIKFASSVSAEIYDEYRKAVLYEITPMKIYEIEEKGKELTKLDEVFEESGKGEYPHFMLKEINELGSRLEEVENAIVEIG